MLSRSPVAAPDWLIVVDMQNIFGRPDSAWFTPRFNEIVPLIQRLIRKVSPHVVFTRFLAPQIPIGSWIPYYQQWPFALQDPTSYDYELVEALKDSEGIHIDATTFSKWTPQLSGETAMDIDSPLWLAGVSTDCCVLSTALAAADQGRHVKVIQDACAGVDDSAHRRALDVMQLYQPLIEIVTATQLLGEEAIPS